MMAEKFMTSLAGLGSFGIYFGASVVLILLFALFYAMVTPYRELSLIREGNAAAAASYSGALLGFTIPLASAVTHSVGLIDMVIWGVVALVVQVAAFCVVRIIFPSIVQDIPNNQTAKGIFLGAAALAIGIINAACMSY
jgi:putative membrane protein